MKQPFGLFFGLIVLLSSPSLADEKAADPDCPVSAGVLVLEDGSRVEILCYGVQEDVVWLTTSEGDQKSVLRSQVDFEATEQANGNGAAMSDPGPSAGEAPPPTAVARNASVAGDDGKPSAAGGAAYVSPELPVAFDGAPPPEPPDVIARDDRGRVTVRAVRLGEVGLDIDGKLEENIYRRTPSMSGFIQQEPHEGEGATEKTEAWIFFDDENVYISARCWDSHPEREVANEMRRDNMNLSQNQNFAVILDTFYDRRNGYMFMTNPLGGLFDAQVTDERNINSDWNTVWQVKTGRSSEGWTVEMAIPFKSLRYKSGASQVWSVNFRRTVRWKNETSYLTPIAASFRHGGLYRLSQAATLVGVEPPARSLNLEIKPYATAGTRTDLTADEPYANDLDGQFGFDVKYGLTRSITSDFTYNTDFAQVEVDEQQVNLTRFGLFFPEKREFFLEGQGIFNFGGRSTRRWGGGGGGSDMPIMFFSRRIGLDDEVMVPINAGGRVTGRSGKYSIGALAMQTEAVPGAEIATTNFGVARVKRDILGRSNIGFIGTYRSAVFDQTGSNGVFGVDGNFTFLQNLNINTYWARSQTDGLTENDDSYMGRLHYGGDRYGLTLEHLVIQDNFRPEVGFMRREDMRKNHAQVRFSPRPQSIDSIRKFSFEGNFSNITNNLGTLETRNTRLEFKIDFERGDHFEINYTRSYEFLDEEFDITDDVIIPIGGYDFQDVRYSYRFGPQWNVAGRSVSGWVSFRHGTFFSGNRKEVSYWGRVEVTPQLSLEPRLALNWIDLKEGSFTTNLLSVRANYTFTPRAFVGALVQYNSDASSFSSNIRFRWEYQPGSDLYVVYSDGRDTTFRGFPQLENRSFVIKFTRLFRL